MSPTPRLVVHTHAPLRRRLLIAALVVLGCLALFVAFEWGRSNVGFGSQTQLDRTQLLDQIGKLEAENRRLRLDIAKQETERIGQIRERSDLARNIGEMQAQLAQAASDLAFYRGVAGDHDDLLKIQQFRITRGAGPNQYILRLVLGRPLGRDDASINGRIRMTFEGTTAATPVNLDLAAVSNVEGGELMFSYRYSQTIQLPLQMPAGFTPVRTALEISPARKGVNPVRTSFAWAVEN